MSLIRRKKKSGSVVEKVRGRRIAKQQRPARAPLQGL